MFQLDTSGDSSVTIPISAGSAATISDGSTVDYDCTVLCLVEWTSHAVAGLTNLISLENATYCTLGLRYRGSTNNFQHIRTQGTTTSAQFTTGGSFSASAGDLVWVMIGWDASGRDPVIAAYNITKGTGHSYIVYAQTSANILQVPDRIAIGTGVYGTADDWRGKIGHVFVLDKLLSESEFNALGDDPMAPWFNHEANVVFMGGHALLSGPSASAGDVTPTSSYIGTAVTATNVAICDPNLAGAAGWVDWHPASVSVDGTVTHCDPYAITDLSRPDATNTALIGAFPRRGTASLVRDLSRSTTPSSPTLVCVAGNSRGNNITDYVTPPGDSNAYSDSFSEGLAKWCVDNGTWAGSIGPVFVNNAGGNPFLYGVWDHLSANTALSGAGNLHGVSDDPGEDIRMFGFGSGSSAVGAGIVAYLTATGRLAVNTTNNRRGLSSTTPKRCAWIVLGHPYASNNFDIYMGDTSGLATACDTDHSSLNHNLSTLAQEAPFVSYDAGTPSITVTGTGLDINVGDVCEINDGDAARCMTLVVSTSEGGGNTTVTLERAFAISPSSGTPATTVGFGPLAYHALSVDATPGGDYYGTRCINTATNSGYAYVIAIGMWNTAPGFVTTHWGKGGSGYAQLLGLGGTAEQFNTPTASGVYPQTKYFEAVASLFGGAIMLVAGAQQSPTDPEDMGSFVDRVPSDWDVAYTYETIHPNGSTISWDDQSGYYTWPLWMVQNHTSKQPVAVAWNLLGKAITQLADGTRRNAAHPNSYGHYLTASEWMRQLSGATTSGGASRTSRITRTRDRGQ
jgi:hypothetical protein